MSSPLDERDLLILAGLREDGGMRLAGLAKLSGLPLSTVHARLQGRLAKCIRRRTVLLEFEALGCPVTALILWRVPPKRVEGFAASLAARPQVNSLFRVTNGFDVAAEAVFPRLAELEAFLGEVDREERPEARVAVLVTGELCRERFLVGEGAVKGAGRPSLTPAASTIRPPTF